MTDLIIHKNITPAEVNFQPGERSFVAWITMDVVDNEGDVVVAAGVDYKSVFMGVPGDPAKAGNPVVMAVHDYKRWPLGTCEWIKLARPSARSSFSGLYAKTLIDTDPDAVKVFGMIQRRVVRGVSIGFRPPDDARPSDWGPPTREELKARPDWASARRIIRRCVLLEYSVVPIPMNQASLIVAVSKGLELPSYLETAVNKHIAKEGHDYVLYDHTGHHVLGRHPTREAAVAQEAAVKAHEADAKSGDHVAISKAMGGGCGTIKSLHRGGMVPDVHGESVMGDDEHPAARVELHDGDHGPSGVHKAMHVAHLSPIDAGDGPGVDGDDDADDEAKALSGASGTGGGYTDEPAHGDPNRTEPPNPDQSGDDADFDDEDDEPEPIRKGDRVSFAKGATHPPGVGVVKSIHTSGKVPGCVNHAMASDEMPHARVKLYKSMDHPFHYHETDDHAGVPVTALKRLETLTYTPSGKGEGAKAVVAAKGERSFTMHGTPIVPPFRTRAQFEAEIERKVRAQLATQAVDTLAQDAMDRILGTI